MNAANWHSPNQQQQATQQNQGLINALRPELVRQQINPLANNNPQPLLPFGASTSRNSSTVEQPVIVHPPPQMYQPQPQQQQQNTAAKNKRLQVDDALSYLERVRNQFAQTPERYNEFLEVMKEFKNHTIDTREVIYRVSTIFQSHPELIIGFNTFLPPGFEVKIGEDGNYIQIDQPNGGHIRISNIESGQSIVHVHATQPVQPQYTFQIQPVVAPPELMNRIQQQQIQPTVNAPHEIIVQAQQPQEIASILPVTSPKHRVPEMSPPIITKEVPPSIRGISGSQLQQQQQFLSNVPQQQQSSFDPTEVAMEMQQEQPIIMLGSPDQNANVLQSPQQQPIHFEQALGYLNKIKERFSNKPEIYQQFLSILGNYQRSDGIQKMSESSVYQEVAKLFQNEMDLMRDFRDFLPDASLDDLHAEQLNQHLQLEMVGREKSSSAEQSLGGEQRGVGKSTASNGIGVGKKRPLPSSISGQASTSSAAKKSKGQTNKIVYDTPLSEILEEIPLKDFIFFEKVHHALQSEAIFINFMRSLSLYTKSILSKSELFDFVQPFLASYPHLLKEFKDILGGKGEIERHPNKQIPLEERLPSDKANNIDFTHSKQMGVSYRSLPDDYEQAICSGRTDLDKKVLNDKVCYPIWSSENTSSASKKSSFEEIMCRTEDERFEVDILIETNDAANHALEYAERKIASMSIEEAKKWMAENETKLGCSYTVISRAVRKLYGEVANKILTALKENPHIAIPAVRGRFREKELEWKNVRDNEYKLIWREQVEKNYLKSLDIQSLTFKANDGKYIRTRNIISQLETIYEERREKLENNQPTEWGPQLVIECNEDRQIFQDANELIRHYVKRHLNSREKKGIDEILSSLIPRLFQLNGQFVEQTDDAEANESTSEETLGHEHELTTSVMSNDHEKSVPNTESAAKDEEKEKSRENVMPSEKQSTSSATADPETALTTVPLTYTLFFGTNPWLLFIRLYTILCERLSTIRKHTKELVRDYEVEMKFQREQEEAYKKHPDREEAKKLYPVMRDIQNGLRLMKFGNNNKNSTPNPENYYQIMLQEMKNWLDGTVDATNFEDSLRNMFGTKAYICFTMDKMINAIATQLKAFISDNSSMKCLQLFDDYYRKRTNGFEEGALAKQANAEYTAEAEKLLINEKCYKMHFLNHENPIITVELIDTNQPESESGEEEEEKESSNVVMLSEWEDFLKRNGTDLSLLAKKDDVDWRNFRGKMFMKRNFKWRMALANQTINNLENNKGDNANQEDASSTPVGKKKLPQFFFASSGFCNLLNVKNISGWYKEMQMYGENIQPDLLIRKGAPGASRKKHRKVSGIKRKRWITWMEKHERDVSATWFSANCQTQICMNPRFKYLKFTKYTSKS